MTRSALKPRHARSLSSSRVIGPARPATLRQHLAERVATMPGATAAHRWCPESQPWSSWARSTGLAAVQPTSGPNSASQTRRYGSGKGCATRGNAVGATGLADHLLGKRKALLRALGHSLGELEDRRRRHACHQTRACQPPPTLLATLLATALHTAHNVALPSTSFHQQRWCEDIALATAATHLPSDSLARVVRPRPMIRLILPPARTCPECAVSQLHASRDWLHRRHRHGCLMR